jgi:hypothetical protein
MDGFEQQVCKDATPIPSSLNDIAKKFLDKFLK